MNANLPLVSILIPAYNERFFAEAFASARAQTYRAIEIVVCDDSPGEAIGALVTAAADPRVRYVRNASRRGFSGNFTQCFELARGDFIKFLNDDDRLLPGCVEQLAGVLIPQPGVVLATSRRRVIDERGTVSPDIPATTALSQVPALMSGRDLGDFLLVNSVNFIGEPSTVLFRRGAVRLEGPLFAWGGRDYHCLADMSLWLRVMAQGLAYYDPAVLSEYRVHRGQEQRQAEALSSCFVERLAIVRQARTAGYLARPGLHRSALEAVARGYERWLQVGAPDERQRAQLQALLREVAADMPA